MGKKRKTPDLKTFQKEAEQLQYTLRSSFFYRRHSEFKQLIQEIEQINASQYDWSSPSELGISRASWRYIQKKAIPPCHVFCHPELIRDHPHLIAYYRCIAILSQKGAQRLAFAVKSLEERKGKPLSRERSLKLAKTFNVFVSTLIEGDPTFSVVDAQLTGAMNFGAQINGSWRGEIGKEGTRRVRELLLKHFIDHNLIKGVTLMDGTLFSFKEMTLSGPPTLPPIDHIQGFVATNGYKVVFGSEPDVSIVDPKGVIVGAVEVKAGLDPAGALERYGAAKKSFDRVLNLNTAADTIYLASTITEGIKKEMERDRLVKRAFNLTEVFTSDETKEKFLAHIQWLMHL